MTSLGNGCVKSPVLQARFRYQHLALRACLKIADSANHELDHGEVNHRLTGNGQRLVVLAEPTILSEPGEGSLDDPAPREHLESLVCPADDRKEPSSELRGPPDELTGVTGIGPDDLQPGEEPPQLREYEPGTDPVLKGGGMHHHR